MNTSYDNIWQMYLENCKTTDSNLPTEPSDIYPKIKNAVLLLNNRMRSNFECNDEFEIVSPSLSDDQLIILAHYLKLVFLQNQRVYYETLLQPFASDMGFRNFTAQINSVRESVVSQENFIEKLIINQTEDFL